MPANVEWSKAVEIILVKADFGETTKLKTTAKLLWDDQNLYVAFYCEDHDIWGTMMEHDDPIYEEEVVEVFLSPNGDLTDYFELEVSPNNITWDGRIRNSTGLRPDDENGKLWTCNGLRTDVQVVGTLDDHTDHDTCWSVEMAIPFRELTTAPNIPPKPGDIWRMNLCRIDRTPTSELQSWSPVLRSPIGFHTPARFGFLIFEE